MIKADHKKFWEIFIVVYARIWLKRVFTDVRVHILHNSEDMDMKQENIQLSTSKSVLMISNHFSFWDGFTHLIIGKKYFKKKIFIMMLEEQLAVRKFLRYTGCFSVKKRSREILTSLNYAVEKLDNPENIVLIFPQGEIKSIYDTTLEFQKGIDYILKKEPVCDIWFNVSLINFFSSKKPRLNMYLKKYKGERTGIQKEFSLFTEECKTKESEETTGEPLA